MNEGNRELIAVLTRCLDVLSINSEQMTDVLRFVADTNRRVIDLQREMHERLAAETYREYQQYEALIGGEDDGRAA
jgi:hypothetical protein